MDTAFVNVSLWCVIGVRCLRILQGRASLRADEKKKSKDFWVFRELSILLTCPTCADWLITKSHSPWLMLFLHLYLASVILVSLLPCLLPCSALNVGYNFAFKLCLSFHITHLAFVLQAFLLPCTGTGYLDHKYLKQLHSRILMCPEEWEHIEDRC